MDELLDRAPCGFVAFRDDAVVVAANATLLERLGYAREEVVGRPVEMLLTVPGRIFYQSHFFPLVKLHGEAREIFLLLRAKDGTDVAVLLNAARRERAGAFVTDCVMMEVRERRKFEDALLQAKQAAERAAVALQERTRQLEQANAQLEEQAVELELQQQQLTEQALELEREREAAIEANRAKSAFLAVMSHELRTPLNAIGGYVQLLEMGVHGPLTDGQRDSLARVNRAQRHLLGLINDVLNLARIEAGRVEYHIGVLAVHDLVTAVVPMIEPQAQARELTLALDVDRALAVRADPEKLQQVLINLLTNAVKFTPPGGRITVAARRDADERVRLEVRDTGIGIPEEMLGRVFEPFVQVNTARTRGAEGTGLGLAISRDLARGMGGDLVATSTPGEGSVFTIVLAAAEPPVPAAPRASVTGLQPQA